MKFDASEVVESTADPAFLVSTAGTILAVNQAARRIVGRAGKPVVDTPLCSLCSDPAGKVLHYLNLCARTREAMPGALTWKADSADPHETYCEGAVIRPRYEGSPAIIFLRCRRKEDAANNFLVLNEKISALSREIAERKRVEQERDLLLTAERAAREEAERISRMKDEFLATLSHELRTPLNAILGWTQILQLHQPGEAELKQGLEVIERNTRVQTQLIEDLLDMSRIISGKVRLDVQRVDLAVVVEAAIQSVLPALESKGIRLHTVLDPIGGTVMGDPNRLQQVLWNLLSNAAKFTPKGGRVQVLLERVNSHIEVSVVDNGQGIKPEFLPHVFERFQQADSSSTRQYGGLGLGLAIVRHLVELHGGKVRAKSPGIGQGSTFVVVLPLVAVHDEQIDETRLHPRSGSQVRAADCPSMSGIKVLAVDDEPDSLKMVARVLELCGCVVLTATSAAEGLELVKRERPDVLVSDIGMPQEDGYALLHKVRSLRPEEGGNTPAIALTAFARSEDRRRAMLAGFQMHVSKPVESAELMAVVANVAGLTRPG